MWLARGAQFSEDYDQFTARISRIQTTKGGAESVTPEHISSAYGPLKAHLDQRILQALSEYEGGDLMSNDEFEVEDGENFFPVFTWRRP